MRLPPIRSCLKPRQSIHSTSQRVACHNLTCRPARGTCRRVRPPEVTRRQFKRFKSSGPGPEPSTSHGPAEPAPSLSQRLRKLSREYGWSALGVYMLLSALDFPFCFLAVRTLGTDRIGRWEHIALDWFWKVVPWPFPANETQPGREGGILEGERGVSPLSSINGGLTIEEAEKRNASSDASTQGVNICLQND